MVSLQKNLICMNDINISKMVLKFVFQVFANLKSVDTINHKLN